MRIYKKQLKDKKTKWYIDFRDISGKRHRLAGFTDKKTTMDLARNLESLISCRIGGGGLTPDLQRWIDILPNSFVKSFIRWGLLDSHRTEGNKPLYVHLEEWKQSLIASSKTVNYINLQYGRVSNIFKDSGFNYFADIKASNLQRQISQNKRTVRTKNGKGRICSKVVGEASQATKNYYLKACKQFCKWMVQDGRASQNPLRHLKPVAAMSKKRTALEPQELRELLKHAQAAGKLFGLEGYQRYTLYRFAAETGLRASEIKSLKISDIDLLNGIVRLDAKYTKNRQEAVIPLRAEMIEKLKMCFESKLPHTQALKMPYNTNLARMLRQDLKSAGVDIDSNRGLVDFHCLRHTFGSMLAASGVHPKTAQQLMRHSDINLTMSRYTHILRGQESHAINSLPDLDSIPDSQNQKMTGTDGSFQKCHISAKSVPQNQKESEKTRIKDTINRGNQIAVISSKPTISNEKQRLSGMGRGGIEPPTHGFSVRNSAFVSTCQ